MNGGHASDLLHNIVHRGVPVPVSRLALGFFNPGGSAWGFQLSRLKLLPESGNMDPLTHLVSRHVLQFSINWCTGIRRVFYPAPKLTIVKLCCDYELRRLGGDEGTFCLAAEMPKYVVSNCTW